MNEELDSQLSAMFDNELPAAQCELLARRLSRDEDLKARWGVYAAIGATIRAEGGARLNGPLARKVSVAISAEPAVQAPDADLPLSQATAAGGNSPGRSRVGGSQWWVPVGGVAVAASVAAAAILWVRYESSPQDAPFSRMQASTVGSAVRQSGYNVAVSSTPDSRPSYVVPKSSPRRSIVPTTQLANYVVAHSEFSSPVNRRNLLSTLMASESGTAGSQSGSDEPTEDMNDDAKSPQ